MDLIQKLRSQNRHTVPKRNIFRLRHRFNKHWISDVFEISRMGEFHTKYGRFRADVSRFLRNLYANC